jgi:hypothetical protein
MQLHTLLGMQAEDIALHSYAFEVLLEEMLMKSGARGVMSHGLGGKEQGGPSISRPTWPKDPGQEAPNQGGLEDRYMIKCCK